MIRSVITSITAEQSVGVKVVTRYYRMLVVMRMISRPSTLRELISLILLLITNVYDTIVSSTGDNLLLT